MRYEWEKGVCDFEMAWGSEIAKLFVAGNTFWTTEGKKLDVTPEDVELLEKRVQEYCKIRNDQIQVSRTMAPSDLLPAHYKDNQAKPTAAAAASSRVQ